MYKLQYSQGSYDPSICLTENNIINNLNQMPQILDQLIFEEAGYGDTMNFMSSAFGDAVSSKVKVLGNDSVSWAVQKRPTEPIAFKAWVSGTGAAGSEVITTTVQNNAANKGDVFKTKNGYVLSVIATPTKTTTGYTVKFKVKGGAAAVPSTEFSNGSKAGRIGTEFQNGSTQGFGNVAGMNWFSNWFTIARKTMNVDNSFLTTVTWITNDRGQKYWFFQYQQQLLREFRYELELSRWFSKKNTNDFGATWLTDEDGNEIKAGSGYIEQVQGANSSTYVPYVDNFVEKLKDTITQLITYGGGATYDKITTHTGSGYGSRVFDAAMRSDFREGYKTLFYNAVEGRAIDVGEYFKSYSFLEKELVIMPNMTFIDPRVHTGTSIDGFSSEAYNFFFIPTQPGGQEQLITNVYKKTPTGGDRRFVAKYQNGMISPMSDAPAWVANGYDGHIEHYLSEGMICALNPKNTASLIAAAA